MTDMEWLRELAEAANSKCPSGLAFPDAGVCGCPMCTAQLELLRLGFSSDKAGIALAETVLALVEALEVEDHYPIARIEPPVCARNGMPCSDCPGCQALAKAAALREGTNVHASAEGK